MPNEVDEAFIARYYTAQQEAAEAINARNKFHYDQACRNAAQNAIQTGQSPVIPPVGFAVRPKPDSFPMGGFENTSEPCSTVTVYDFMPKLAQGEIGNGIGALIPGTTRFYYDRTNQTHEAGESRIVNGQRFVYSRPSPFGGFWVMQ